MGVKYCKQEPIPLTMWSNFTSGKFTTPRNSTVSYPEPQPALPHFHPVQTTCHKKVLHSMTLGGFNRTD